MRAARWFVATLVLFTGGTFPAFTAAALAAERYPTKPLRIIVGSTPGSTPDVLARLIGAKLGESWGQPDRKSVV